MSLADLTSSLKTFSIYGIVSAHAITQTIVNNQQNTIYERKRTISTLIKELEGPSYLKSEFLV
jgi:hypothetical protein